MGLEPTRLLHPTRFPGELLSHSVNPPYGQLLFLYSVQRHLIIYHKWTSNASKSFCFFEKSFWVVRKVQLNAFKYVMLCLKRWEQSERICIFGGAYFGEMGTFPLFWEWWWRSLALCGNIEPKNTAWWRDIWCVAPPCSVMRVQCSRFEGGCATM